MQSTQTPHSSQCTKKVKWQAANQVGVPNLYLHKYHLYHSRCTSSIREAAHKQSTPQGFSPGSTSQIRDGVQQPRVAGKSKHGKHVPCLGEDALGYTQEDCQVNTRTLHAGIHRILPCSASFYRSCQCSSRARQVSLPAGMHHIEASNV